jgi:AAA domain
MYIHGGNHSGAEAPSPAPGELVHAQNTDSQNSSSSPFTFRKAVKHDAKLRLAVAGPGGSGKTYSLLKLATEMGGKIAVFDSEHGSASKYADEFAFDVLEMDTFDPAIVPDLIAAVAEQGYATLIIDSWSHFWMGTGGELEQVDQITARSKSNNSWAAWRYISPKHTKMIDAMLSAPIHILVSMRVKTEWIVEKDEKTGKTQPRKVGLQPVMRDGVEYEFDVCGDMDQENNLVITKTRCSRLNGKILNKPGSELAAILREWLNSPAPKPAATVSAAADPVRRKYWSTRGEAKRLYAAAREALGEVIFRGVLEQYGVFDSGDLPPADKAVECYERLMALLIAQQPKEVA